MTEDLRPDDITFIMENGLPNGAFGNIWENELHKTKHPDHSQERWHISRMSMLAGYLLGKGKTADEVIDLLRDHRDDLQGDPR